MKTKLFEPYVLICSLCAFPVKPHQSVRAADLGTSCFHSADLPACPAQSSVMPPTPSGLPWLLQLSNWQHTCLAYCKYCCPHHSSCLPCSSHKSQVKDRDAVRAAVHHGSLLYLRVINSVLRKHASIQSDERHRSFQTVGTGSFSLSGHYRVVINKSSSL